MSRFLLPREFLSAPYEGADLESRPAPFVVPTSSLPPNYIHLDYAAATPLDVEVFDAMQPWLFAWFGNPSAHVHAMGALSMRVLSESREWCARFLDAEFEEVTFTASATESNNLFLRGLAQNPRLKRTKILFGATEHSSIAATLEGLQNLGKVRAIKIPVTLDGQVDLDFVRDAVDDETLAVCLMDVNNETGIVQGSLAEVIGLAHARGALVHVDAVQGFARGDFASRALPWDSMVISAGKIYGPRGAALLAIRRRGRPVRILPQLTGGGHEHGLRASTSNVAGIVGFVRAMQITERERQRRNSHLDGLVRTFEDELSSHVPLLIHGSRTQRAPGITMMSIPGVNPLKLLECAQRVGIGLGSACKTGTSSPSQILLEMGVEPDAAAASFRASFGAPSTEEDAREGARCLGEAARRLAPSR